MKATDTELTNKIDIDESERYEYCNLTMFGQDWTENKNFLSVCKILAGPLLKLRQL